MNVFGNIYKKQPISNNKQEQLDGACRTSGGKSAGTAWRSFVCTSFHCFLDTKISFFSLKKKVKVIRCNVHTSIIRWQITQSVKVIICSFAPVLTVSEILKFTFRSKSRLGSTIFAMTLFDGK